jgi:hypothetical protein
MVRLVLQVQQAQLALRVQMGSQAPLVLQALPVPMDRMV